MFSEEGNIFKDSMPHSSNLKNCNNFNHPHIDIGKHWEKLRKIETKIPFGEFYIFMKKETITRRLSLVGGGCGNTKQLRIRGRFQFTHKRRRFALRNASCSSIWNSFVQVFFVYLQDHHTTTSPLCCGTKNITIVGIPLCLRDNMKRYREVQGTGVLASK